MKIDKTQNINFQARFIKNTKISKFITENNRYKQQDVSLLEINPHNVHDVWALDGIANKWEYDKFSVNVFNNVYEIYNGKEQPKYRAYVLTKQKDNFKNLIAEDILGIADMIRLTKRETYVSHLQVKPDYVYATKPEYKGIGTAIINAIKEKCHTIRLSSMPERSVKNFYKKLGFVPYTNSETKLIWKRSFEQTPNSTSHQ